jgi:lipooligosaccharide transport system ATP-binding protein
MGEIVRAENLCKRYGNFTAVDAISFAVQSGECFGFLGPNAAGKTTVIRMVSCVSPPTAGALSVDGLDVRRHPRQIKALLGFVPQEENLDVDLRVRQNLEVYARYFDLPREVAQRRIDETLALFQLQEREHQPIDHLSTGLKRRLGIARALINVPRILVLDEPTVGLDPQARRLIWQKLRALKAQGMTTLVTTHYMDEAAYLCDRVAIMHQGRIVAEGPPAKLVERHAGQQVVEVHPTPGERPRVLAHLSLLPGVDVEEVDDALYVYAASADSLDTEAVRLTGEKVVFRRPNLEDVFLRLVGRGLSE